MAEMKHQNNSCACSEQAQCLMLKASLEEMPRFYAFTDQVCEKNNIEDPEKMEIQLSLEELIVNVINYAYPDHSKENGIELHFDCKEDKTFFTIIDEGIAFDPTQHEEVDTSSDIDERTVGGLGIHMVRQMMDSMSYHRCGNKNVLSLEKRINVG